VRELHLREPLALGVVGRDVGAPVGLELDEVGAGGRGALDQPSGELDVAAVVLADLGDHRDAAHARRSAIRRRSPARALPSPERTMPASVDSVPWRRWSMISSGATSSIESANFSSPKPMSWTADPAPVPTSFSTAQIAANR